MSFEVPTDLINQVQIALRKDAGLSSYNPYDATPLPLPSLTAAIADLDQSSSSVRCNCCQGRLLSGMQSMICVYCGKQQKGDVPHELIAFNSTYAYRFLLESLGLGGSEVIVQDKEESETKRGQRMPKDEILLSKLLDLRIPWLDAPEKSETSGKDKNLELNGSLVTLTGVDLINYLQEPDSNIAFNAFQGQSVQTNNNGSIKTEEFTGRDNIDLFQNVPEESGDNLSEWEASFQFADSHNQQQSSNSADLFPSSTIDLTAHIDSVFGSAEKIHDVKPNVDLFLASSMVNKLKEDDLFTTSLSQPLDSASKDVYDQPSCDGELFKDNEWQSQSIVSTSVDNKVNSAQPLDSAFNDVNVHASNNGDWFEDNQWQSQSTVDVGLGVDNNVNSAESQMSDSASKDVNDQSSDNGEWFQDNQWQSQSTVNVGNEVNSAESQPLDSASTNVNTHSSGNGDWVEDNQGKSQSTVNIGVNNDVNLAESQPLDSASNNVNDPSLDKGYWFQDNAWQNQSTVIMTVDKIVSSAEPQPLDSASKKVNDQSSDTGDWFEDKQRQSQNSVNVGVDNNVNSAELPPLDSVFNDVNDQSAYDGDWFAGNQWQSQSNANIGVDNKAKCDESQPFDSVSKDVNVQSLLYNGDWLEDNQWQSQSSVDVAVDNKVNSAEAQPLDFPSKDFNNQSSENGDWFADNQWQSQSTVKVEVDSKASCAEFELLDLPSKDFNNQSLGNGKKFADNQWQSQSTVNVEVDSNANSAEFQQLDLPNDFNNQSSENGDWFADNQWQSQSTVNIEVDSKANSTEFQPLDLPSNEFNNESSNNGDWLADNQWQSQSTVNVVVDSKANSADIQPLDLPSKDFNNQSSNNGDWFADNQWQSQRSANVKVDSKANSAETQLDPGSKDLNYQSSDNGDWFQDNKWRSQSSMNATIDNEVNSAKSQTSDSAGNRLTLASPSLEGFDWFSDNQWQTNITSVPNNNVINENEDQFDEWNDFTSSNSPQVIVPEGTDLERNGDLSSNEESAVKILKPKDDVEMLMSSIYDFSLMSRNKKISNGSSKPLDLAVNGHSSDNVNLFQDSKLQSQNAMNVSSNKKVNSAQPLDSVVNNLTLAGPASESIDLFNDNLWRTVATSVSNDKAIDENEDSFDEWNDFTSANNPEEASSIANTIKEKMTDMNNSHSIYQEVDLGSFFPGGRNVDLSSSALKPKDEIEILMSPMHDFSVMHNNSVSNNSLPQPLDSDNVDWFQDNQWQSQSTTVIAGSKNVNSTGSQPLASAVNSLTNPSLQSIDLFNNNQWQANTTSAPNDKTLDENEDSFNEWNDFTSANNPPVVSSSITHKILDKDMFSSPGNSQELDFGSFFSEGSIPKRSISFY